MPRMKKKFAAWAALFSLEFLSLGPFAYGHCSSTNHYMTPLLKAAADSDPGVVKLDSRRKIDSGRGFEVYREPTLRWGGFLITTPTPEVFVRNLVVNLSFIAIILSLNVPRYISKSVLNL
jgi:hypothetical protein